MKILLIGGNSYIGRSFLERFSQQYECRSIRRTESFQDYFTLKIEDFRGFDAIINCAAIVHQYRPDPILAQRINTDLPLFLAKRSKEAGIPHFIQLSTIAVYGTATDISLSTPESPDTIYGKTKYEADRELMQLGNEAFAVTLIRPPMVYGPNAPGNLRSLIRLIRFIPILPFDYRTNQRGMIHIENLLNAIGKVLETTPRGVVLLRDAYSPALSELCRAIASGLGIKRYFFPLPHSLVRFFCRFSFLPFAKLYGSLDIDDSATRSRIGEYATVSFPETIRQTVQGDNG